MKHFRNSRVWLYLAGLCRNRKECFIGLWHALRLFFAKRTTGRQVLVVEFNPFHGETLPGFTQYFQDLGYEVTVLTRHVTYADSPFVRMSVRPHHFCLTIWGMRHFLKSRKAREFDFILYNSAHLYLEEYRYYGRIREFFDGAVPQGRLGFAMIEHSLKPGVDLDYFRKLPDEAPAKHHLFHNSFVLTEQTVEEHAIPMLNPCRFGDVAGEHRLNSRRVFITIGNVASHSRNFSSLFEELRRSGHAEEFEVWIVGRVMETSLLKSLPPNVKVLGRLTFAEMYARLENADFFLPLLDLQTQPDYLQGCTSGSRQLILGFGIPPVIHAAFATHYGFPPDSCITYHDDASFQGALESALQMSPQEYALKQATLRRAAAEVAEVSLDNLRSLLQASSQPEAQSPS